LKISKNRLILALKKVFYIAFWLYRLEAAKKKRKEKKRKGWFQIPMQLKLCLG
jgi:hypothetical protein